jgi:glycosyltransferase involved in cell wall biosynthesis
MVKISVIIPTFNRRRTLRSNLLMLARQTLPALDFEVLVSDDGSIDGTLEMLTDIHLPYRLHTFRTGAPEGVNGVTWGMNLGLENASGEYVCFMDNDMLLKRDAMEALLATFRRWREQDEDVLVRGWWKDNRLLRRLKLNHYDYRRDVKRNAKLRCLLQEKDDLPVKQVQTTHMAVRRQLALDVGGFPRESTQYGFDGEKVFQHNLKDQKGLRFVFEPRIYGLHGPFRGDATRFDYSNCTKRSRRLLRLLSSRCGQR